MKLKHRVYLFVAALSITLSVLRPPFLIDDEYSAPGRILETVEYHWLWESFSHIAYGRVALEWVCVISIIGSVYLVLGNGFSTRIAKLAQRFRHPAREYVPTQWPTPKPRHQGFNTRETVLVISGLCLCIPLVWWFSRADIPAAPAAASVKWDDATKRGSGDIIDEVVREKSSTGAIAQQKPWEQYASTAPASSKGSSLAGEPNGQTIEKGQPDASALPATGTDIVQRFGRRGLGQLTVINGTPHDAAVKLVDRVSGYTRRYVFVRAGEQAKLDGIAPGSCSLRFILGSAWNSTALRFGDVSSAQEFSEGLTFKEILSAGETQYSTYRVTLHPVINGTARTKPISEDEVYR